MKQLDLLAAYRQGKGFVVNLVRTPLTDGIDVIGKVELLALNDAVEPVRGFVTAQPAQHVPMGYDAGPRGAPCVGLLVNEPNAARVVDMAMS